MTKRSLLFIFLFISLSGNDALWAQAASTSGEIIDLYNPSFEDMPRASQAPRGWLNCGWADESPPDTQPDATFKVYQIPSDGNSYLGLVTRDNDTWESVGQRLSSPLKGGKCYSFSIHLARSESYISRSQATGQTVNYNTPSQLRIWGGAGRCDRRELLAETKVINHFEWQEYVFKFSPSQTHTYLMLEATYKMPTLFPTNGNLLVDNASSIVLLPCSEEPSAPEPAEEQPAIAQARINTAPQPNTTTPTQPQPKQEPAVVNNTPTPKPRETPQPTTPKIRKDKILTDLSSGKIKEGQIIQISKLYFEADSFALMNNSFEVLDEIYSFLKENPKVIVEIGGHTNNLPDPDWCDWMSEKRAKEVAVYLKAKGIRDTRLQYKGYGKRSPIATNKTAVGRKRNQRVEIKILSLDG